MIPVKTESDFWIRLISIDAEFLFAFNCGIFISRIHDVHDWNITEEFFL